MPLVQKVRLFSRRNCSGVYQRYHRGVWTELRSDFLLKRSLGVADKVKHEMIWRKQHWSKHVVLPGQCPGIAEVVES